MKRLYCVLFIFVFNHQVCAATDTKPSKGRAPYPIPSGFSNNNGRFEFEITVVERVSRNGRSLSPHKHFIKYEHSSLRTGTVFYRLVAFGRTFLFRLDRDNSHLSPLLNVEHVYDRTRRLSFAGDLRHCFYRGDLQGDLNSSAVLNLCNGLRGSFVTSGERYFIEPTKEQDTNANTQFRKFHIVFRHPTERNNLSNGPATCGLKDKPENWILPKFTNADVFPSPRNVFVKKLSVISQDSHLRKQWIRYTFQQDTNKPLSLLRGRQVHHANRSRGGTRKRRSTDESFVETLVVADRTMVDAFKSKADLQAYILTLMGVVSQVYRDRSIGNPINIVVVKIALLEYNQRGLHISSDSTRTLKSFCRWQNRVMTKPQKDPEHHDTAVLLTRRNLCRRPGKCDTLGLAELGTMCSPGRSCALAEDSGLGTAYTIAHELGHVFSLPHDGDNNPCTRSRGDQRLMAPSLSFDTKPWSWSNCSRDKITQFLELGYGSCLADKPLEKAELKYRDRLPGELYSVDQQCKMVFGENSSLCPFMEPCRRLWCVKMINNRRGCSTHHMPWADGTPCAKKRWCIRGQCVKKRRPKPVDGNWGEWGPYQECTRRCGGGIAFSYRECNKPLPENGGKYCIGKRKRFRSCNTQECPKGSVDFRAIQCANIHARSVSVGSKRYRNTNWLPKYAGITKQNQCKLYCRMSGTAIYFKLKDKVIDGTPCNPETTDICVDGKCMPAGCDRVLNSNKKTDKCGVCDGDNSSCRRFSGTFNETKFGYNFIFTIPVNSTDIVVTQYGWKNREDPNYLALQSASGTFLLNGGMIIGLGVREFRAAGSKIWYSGSEKVMEQIKINGRVTEAIKVYVLEVGDVVPPNVQYSLNKMVAEPKKFVYKWDRLGRWTQCNKLCQGIRKRRPRCVRVIDGQLVSNSRCDQSTRPSTVTEECNISCRLRWQIENPGRCSARCGLGYQSRVVKCLRVHNDRWGEVLDKHCPSKTKPPLFVRCNGTCEGTKWVYSEWSKCSKSCNGGKQTRSADCVDNFGEILKESDCRPSDKQRLRRQCNAFACPRWTTENWSSCSVTCGSGQQTRLVKCKGHQGIVEERLCKHSRPATTQPCKLQACPYWFAGDWSDCSATCGSGMMTRQIMCLSPGVVARPMSEEKCSAATRPQSSKVCKTQECSTLYKIDHEGGLDDYYWRLSMWTPCSVSCGEKPGTQYRDVDCVLVRGGQQSVVDENHCAHTPKPADLKECQVLPCTTWRHGSWGRCSRLCGKGVQLRVVKCTYDNFKITVDKNCDLKSKPLSIRPCEIRECILTSVVPTSIPTPTSLQAVPSWKTGTWGQCSVTCGSGAKKRTVECGDKSNSCDAKTKPETTASCNLKACPQWKTSQWGECSVTCGQGQRQREVQCRYEDGKASNECDESNKPESILDCVLGECPVWREEPWGECSVSCGEGIRQRSVSCRLPSGQLSSGCAKENKPTSREACNIRPCPTWITGDWGKCSVTCDSGIKVRSVECSDKDFSCNARTKPQTTTQCNLKPCPRWKTSPWGECSVTCGQGQRQREVECRYEDGTTSNQCNRGKKPERIMDCVLEDCAIWREEPWGECSVSCGEGIRQRSVSCRLPSGRLGTGCNKENKPAIREACNIRPCPTWITGDWGKCSVTCGSGIKIRSVECSDKDFSCKEITKPQATTRCNLNECPQWKTSPWGKCSVSCGNGIRRRGVNCRLQNGQLSPGCNEENRPATTEACNIRRCPTWTTGDWGECSVTCGSGIKLRVVECSDKDFPCDARTRPQTKAQCNPGPCPEWKARAWGQCSVSCGVGVRQRGVYCISRNGQLSSGCAQKTKPFTNEACNKRPCPTWLTGDWGKCSVTCGLGVKKRSVECSDKDASCDARTKPQTTAQCNLKTCPQWKTSPWGECSVSCGNGLRRRLVRCHGESSRCDYRSRPKSVERCNPGTCPTWKTGTWSRCSKTCGNGLRTRPVNCHGLNSQCDVKTKPVTRAHCNLGPCAEWKVGDWQQCTVTCGRGWRRRSVECTTRRLRCDYRTKPDVYAMCNMGKCPVWRAGRWGECSVSCGEGVRRRSVDCTGGEGKCNSRTQPTSAIRCNLDSCPQWKAGQWSQCSVSCGDGVISRSVECSGNRGKCDVQTKPTSTASCNLGSCPVWKVGDWGQCSVTCGDGFRKREVTCSRLDVSCDTGKKPQATSSCNPGSCPEWKVGEWGKCTVTCGNGFRRRAVLCSGGTNRCDSKSKPEAIKRCNPGICPTWTAREWSKCSVTCGSGRKLREVTCSRSDVTCDATNKPASTAKCELGACPRWEIGDWNQCSVTCGSGIKTRAVHCSGAFNNCDPAKRPASSTSCSSAPCPRWKVAVWSECSASCGEGVKERLVECVVEDEKSSGCETGTKPAAQASCNLGHCPQWKIGDWTKCSVTCGSGIKQRKIECVSGVDALCDERTKPFATAKCDLGRCPIWHTGRWTGCSRTCGKGIKRRAVGCFSMTTRKQIDNEACEPKLRPATQLECTIKSCVPEAIWRKASWGKCSVYCGIGEKSRNVWCSTKNGKRVPDEYCAGERKPRMTRSCNKNRRCGEWEIGLWSECSKTCGDGTKRRPVRCLHQLDYKGDTFCDGRTRPSEQQPCSQSECPRARNIYQWQTSTWRECSSSCGYGQKSRDIWCVDPSRRNVSDALCNPESKPESSAACYGSKCLSQWKHGDWSPCSRTCARGYQYRVVECIGNTECDKRTKPPVWRPCNRGECGSFLFWRVGKWSKCSVSCGNGVMRRLVKCFARNGSYVDDSFCTTPTSRKPENTRACQMKACPPKTCKDVQLISGLQNDGEQSLNIQGRELQVYCHAMMSQEPKEYITLRTGPADNFAEIYPKRLRNAWQCPGNGSHFEECDCENEDYQQSGASYYSKIRIDLSAMKIIPEDKEFASIRGLNPPAYGTAGDCYSAQGRCPQGRFSINLKETGIRLTSKVMWGSAGQAYSQIIYRYPEGQQVIGKCGGRCGICRPENDVGLKIELVEDES